MNQEENQQQEKPAGVLFGVLAYSNHQEYDEFISRLRDGSSQDVLITIHASLRYSQSRGVFSLEESEAISIALRQIKDIKLQ